MSCFPNSYIYMYVDLYIYEHRYMSTRVYMCIKRTKKVIPTNSSNNFRFHLVLSNSIPKL